MATPRPHRVPTVAVELRRSALAVANVLVRGLGDRVGAKARPGGGCDGMDPTQARRSQDGEQHDGKIGPKSGHEGKGAPPPRGSLIKRVLPILAPVSNGGS